MIPSIRRQLQKFPPLSRRVMPYHVALVLAAAPLFATVQYATMLVVKTFHAPQYVPLLASTIHFSNILAVVATGFIQRSSKLPYLIWPNALAFSLMLPLWFIKPHMAGLFTLAVILVQISRTPVVAAQSAFLRTVYPANLRSWTTAVGIGLFFMVVAVCGLTMGQLFERSEQWVGPVYAAAGLIGLAGVAVFSRLRRMPELNAALQPEAGPRRSSLAEQWSVLRGDSSFRLYEISYMLFGIGNVAMITLFPLYLEEEFQPTHVQATAVMSVIPMLISVLTLPMWGTLLDRHNPLVMRIVFNSIWCIVPLTLFFTPVFGGTYIAVAILGLVQGGGLIIWHLGVNYFARGSNVAVYMGLHQSLAGVRGILTPFLGKALGEWIGYRNIMLPCFVLLAAGTIVIWIEVRRERRRGMLRSFHEVEAAEAPGVPDP